MENKDAKIGKLVVAFGAFCLLLVFVISGVTIFSDSESSVDGGAGILIAATPDFDNKGSVAMDRFQKASDAYIGGSSTERTIHEFYSRRQYPGSPPVIPHPILDEFAADEECLACHANGGFVEKWNRHSPVTPHPEKLMCQQCHIAKATDETFVESQWTSVMPPRLGQSQLPGSPPPFPHALQMREDCVACHTGPGAVAEIKMRHEPRGVCRQCHVPVANDVKPFSRDF